MSSYHGRFSHRNSAGREKQIVIDCMIDEMEFKPKHDTTSENVECPAIAKSASHGLQKDKSIYWPLFLVVVGSLPFGNPDAEMLYHTDTL